MSDKKLRNSAEEVVKWSFQTPKELFDGLLRENGVIAGEMEILFLTVSRRTPPFKPKSISISDLREVEISRDGEKRVDVVIDFEAIIVPVAEEI